MTSTPRSPLISQSQEQHIPTQSNDVQQPKNSYTTVTQANAFLTKDQAIVIDSIENVPLNDYILAVGKITNPTNIRFAYLASKAITDEIIENKRKITVGNTTLEIRPLVTKFKCLILTNVCPIILHHILTNELGKMNIRVGSTMTFLRTGISEPGFSHIMSFRRQI